MKKFIQILLCSLFLFSMTVSAEAVAVERIEIVADKTEFSPEDEYTFTVKTYPETTEPPAIIWSNDDYFIMPVVSSTGLAVAVFPGNATITAQLADNPDIKATLDITVLGDNTERFKTDKISILAKDNYYIGNGDTSHKIATTFFHKDGGLIPENIGGIGWSQYYYAEYTDNFADKKGITRDGNILCISKDAEAAEGLYFAITLKRKSDDAVIATGESNKFNIVKKINITGLKVNGNNAEKSDNGKYTYTTSDSTLTVSAVADREAYYSYQIDGGIIKRAKGGVIDASALEAGTHTVNVYVFGSDERGAAGYHTSSLSEVLSITLNK